MSHRATALFLTLLLAVTGSLFAAPQWEEGDNVQLNTDGTSNLQNEESMVINPNDPDNIIGIWRDFRLGYRRVGVGTSFDGGQTWSDSLLVGTPYMRHSDPVMSYNAEGDIYACILSFDQGVNWNGLFVYPSSDGGVTWGAPITVVDEVAGAFEDKQWINVDRTGSAYHGRIYVPWTRFTNDFTVSHIVLCYSMDTPFGPDFVGAVDVSDINSVQWPTVTCGSDGTVYVAWVAFNLGAIMLDKSTNGGATFGPDIEVTPLSFLSADINGGIWTFAFPAMEADISGGIYDNTIYIIYTDWTESSGLDLFLRKSTDNGVSWSDRLCINDDPTGHYIDQFHPWISINEDGILTAVWYDRRLDPANLDFDLYMAHSFDGGDTWTANQRITEVSSSPFEALLVSDPTENQPDAPKPPEWLSDPDRGYQERAGLIGEYIALATLGDKAHTLWTDTRNGNQDVFGTRVTIGFAPPPPLSPVTGGFANSATPLFEWGKTGATPTELSNFPGTQLQPLYYILEIDDDPLFASIDYVDSGLVVTAKEISSALGDGDWFWRVSAVNDSGRATGFVEEFRLLTIDTGIPDLPTLLEPAHDSVVSYESQQFTWSPADKGATGTAVSYELEISSDSTFATTEVSESNLQNNTYILIGVLQPGTTYYWQVRSYDEAGNSHGFTGYFRFHTEKDYICGDADGNDIVNVSDAVYLISYIFGGGPAPDPFESGNVNCDGTVNISDAVYLISYIFAGGPEPCAECP